MYSKEIKDKKNIYVSPEYIVHKEEAISIFILELR